MGLFIMNSLDRRVANNAKPALYNINHSKTKTYPNKDYHRNAQR